MADGSVRTGETMIAFYAVVDTGDGFEMYLGRNWQELMGEVPRGFVDAAYLKPPTIEQAKTYGKTVFGEPVTFYAAHWLSSAIQ